MITFLCPLCRTFPDSSKIPGIDPDKDVIIEMLCFCKKLEVEYYFEIMRYYKITSNTIYYLNFDDYPRIKNLNIHQYLGKIKLQAFK